MADDSVKLVTLGGECFEATFRGTERPQNTDGVVYLFNLNDLLSNRGERHVQLFRSGQTKLFTPDYDERIEIVRLNAIRRAFDLEELSFNHPYEPGTYKNLTLDSPDFQKQRLVNDKQIQRYIIHKAYWLSHRYGQRLWLVLDEPFDLEYLGATKEDVRRNIWVLSEKQLLEPKDRAGVARPTVNLVDAYENSGAASDETFQRMAIEEAKKSIAEDGRPRPKVGVVVVKDGIVLAKAHRGEIPKCHAEFIALERKLPDAVLTGATVYTTLEPCTTRNHPKVPCATRLTERNVARVVIGMLDPNGDISGRGQRQLRKARVTTDMFKPDLMTEIEELNREFIRAHDSASPKGTPSLKERGSQKSENVTVRDWTTEWTEQEGRFRKLELSGVFAEFWVDDSGAEICSIRSDGKPHELAECKTACGLAGGRLSASPGLKLSETVVSEREHWKRWLYFLKETQGLNRKLTDGSGYIEHLASVSARACLDCAAKTFDG